MRAITRAVLLAMIIGLGGCVLSLNGLYEDDKDLVFDPALVAIWQPNDKDQQKEVWEFQKSGDRPAYKLLYTDKDGHHGVFDVGMVKIGGKRYIDLLPDGETLVPRKEDQRQISDFYIWHLQPLHSFMRVDQIGATLVLTMPNVDNWKKWIDAHPDAIAHGLAGKEKSNDAKFILTAPTSEVRKFISGPMDKPEFWGDPGVFHKLTPATAPSK